MDGYPVALLSYDCRILGGAQTAAGCEKMMRFIDLADTFHLPVIYLVDCPGFMIGPDSELEGIERKSARLAFAMAQMTVPAQAIILRSSFGVAGLCLGRSPDSTTALAWPSGDWGSLPIEGGVIGGVSPRDRISPDAGTETHGTGSNSSNHIVAVPYRGGVRCGEIIDPRETRSLLCGICAQRAGHHKTQLGPKWRLGVRP
jgi:acetyl-CoA carboxylase carboxyltransferase component